MSTPLRLLLYGLSVLAVFAVSFVAGKALIPEDTVSDWTRQADASSAGHESMAGDHDEAHVGGLSVEQGGYTISPVSSPSVAGQPGELSFRILDPEGKPLTGYSTNHEKQLHLITVRLDGDRFRHVHPRLDLASGTWSIPWSWPAGGSYRVFADFVPQGSSPDQALTLSRSVEVGGEFMPEPKPLSRTDSTGGFKATLRGELEAGSSSELTAHLTRGGRPVTDLEPYLGAFGHLVALREGDLGYLHVHAEDGTEGNPVQGHEHAHNPETAGPDIEFAAEAPTPGRYLLYLDFKVDGRVHTAEFVLEAK